MFNKKQKSLIIGSVLGDGSITKHYPGKSNPYLTIQHSEDQLDYLLWKRDRFEEEGFKVSRVYDVSRKYRQYRVNISLPTKEHGIYLRHLLYPNNNKKISRHILNMLDAEGLAIWYMDDGGKRVRYDQTGRCIGRSIGIATHSYTLEEHEIIKQYFDVVNDVDIKIYKDKQYYRLHMNATSANKFLPIIEPYVHETMLYKIDLEYK